MRTKVNKYPPYGSRITGQRKAHVGALPAGVIERQLVPRESALARLLGTRYRLTLRKLLGPPVAEAVASLVQVQALWMADA